MREFEFKYIDDYIEYKYGIPFWCYRIRFRKVRNKNLYYLTFADKYFGDQKKYVNLASEDISYGYSVLNNHLNFSCQEQGLEEKLKQEFQYEIYNNRICFPESECDRIIEWFESIEVINKLTEE